MLAMRVRDRPCRARFWRSSLGRCTSSVPSSSRWTLMGAATVWLSEPLGPLTLTVCPSMATSTPPGTAIGSRPIRDIFAAPLPDVGEDFPTHALLVRLLVGQQPGGRRDDRDAQATEHLGQGVRLRVHPQAGLGDAPDTGDAPLTVRAVLQVDHELLEGAAVLLDVVDRPAGDVALLLEDLGDVGLQLRRRHGSRVVIRLVGVPQTREHVRDRVGHRHVRWCLSRRGSSCAGSSETWRVGLSAIGGARLMNYQLDLRTPGSSPACAISRRQIRHRPNLRKTECGRPHRWQRVYPRTANLGLRFAFSIRAFLAIVCLLPAQRMVATTG